MTVLLHMPLATALDTFAMTPARSTPNESCFARPRACRYQRMDPPAGPGPIRDPGLPGARRPAGRRSGRCPARPVHGHLICVGSLGRHKGQDILVEALAELGDLDWHCVLAGPLDRDPDFVDRLQTRITRLGFAHRVRLTGVLTGEALSPCLYHRRPARRSVPRRDLRHGRHRSARPSACPSLSPAAVARAARGARLQARWPAFRPTDPFRRSGCARRRDPALAG